MTTYFVGTLSIWTLVDAADETAAREAAIPELHKLYAESGSRIGRDFPIEIRTVRPATQEEIDLLRWHNEMVAKYAGR